MSWKAGYMWQTMFCPINEVADELLISSAQAVNGKKLTLRGINHVINVTVEVAPIRVAGIEVTHIRVVDLPHTNLSSYFDKCADKIHSVAKKGGKTLVHCVAGVSRSATICIAYLMKYKRMSLLEAYQLLKMARPVVHPNNGFIRQLVAYEKKLFGKQSVKFVASSEGPIPDVYKREFEEWMAQAAKR